MSTGAVDGFLLDCGFPVLNTSYPASRRELDLRPGSARRTRRGPAAA